MPSPGIGICTTLTALHCQLSGRGRRWPGGLSGLGFCQLFQEGCENGEAGEGGVFLGGHVPKEGNDVLSLSLSPGLFKKGELCLLISFLYCAGSKPVLD